MEINCKKETTQVIDLSQRSLVCKTYKYHETMRIYLFNTNSNTLSKSNKWRNETKCFKSFRVHLWLRCVCRSGDYRRALWAMLSTRCTCTSGETQPATVIMPDHTMIRMHSLSMVVQLLWTGKEVFTAYFNHQNYTLWHKHEIAVCYGLVMLEWLMCSGKHTGSAIET